MQCVHRRRRSSRARSTALRMAFAQLATISARVTMTGGIGIDAVGNQAVRRVLDAVQNVVERGGDAVDVLGIDGSDEGLIQAAENFVDDLVTLVLEHRDFRGGAGQPRIPGTDALEEEPRGLRDNLHLSWQTGGKTSLRVEAVS